MSPVLQKEKIFLKRCKNGEGVFAGKVCEGGSQKRDWMTVIDDGVMKQQK